jgi:hypothetical protein
LVGRAVLCCPYVLSPPPVFFSLSSSPFLAWAPLSGIGHISAQTLEFEIKLRVSH